MDGPDERLTASVNTISTAKWSLFFPDHWAVVPESNSFVGVALRAGLLRATLPLGLSADSQPADRCAPCTSLTQKARDDQHRWTSRDTFSAKMVDLT